MAGARGRSARTPLIIGTNAAAISLGRELHERRELGVEIVGFITDGVATVAPSGMPSSIIGGVEEIPALVKRHNVDRVVVSLTDARGRLPMDKLLDMKLGGVTFDHLASVYEEYTGKIAVENLRPSWLIFSAGFKKSTLVTATEAAAGSRGRRARDDPGGAAHRA